MCTAWNSAMVWVDNELVFTELNTLMTVARDATDKVIEAMSWAEKNKMKEKPIATRKQLQDTPPSSNSWQTPRGILNVSTYRPRVPEISETYGDTNASHGDKEH